MDSNVVKLLRARIVQLERELETKNRNERVLNEKVELLEIELAVNEDKLSTTKTIYKNNLKIVTSERDEFKAKLGEERGKSRGLEKELDALKAEELKLLTSNKWRSDQIVDLEKTIEKFRKELRSLTPSPSSSGPSTPAIKQPRKSYSELKNNASKKRRVEEAVDSMMASTDMSGEYVVKVMENLADKGQIKLKLTSYEAFQFYHSLNMSRRMYVKMKKLLKAFKVADPFPSRRSLEEEEMNHGRANWFTVKTEQTVNKDGVVRTVTVAQLLNVREFLTLRIQHLINNGKLLFDISTGKAIWLTIMGDKGSNEFKLCVCIGNVLDANSCHNLIPLGLFDDEERVENIAKYLKNVIDQLNDLEDVEVFLDDTLQKIPVHQFLGGDMKFQYEMVGHEGASSTKNCMTCYTDSRTPISEYERGAQVELRTEASYQTDSAAKTKPKRRNVKAGSHFVFQRVILIRIIPPYLHIFMGLAQTYGFDILFILARDQDNKTGVDLSNWGAKAQKLVRVAIQKKQKEVEALELNLKGMAPIVLSLEHKSQKVVEPPEDDVSCNAEYCLYSDVCMKNSPYFDARKLVCNDCDEVRHAVCCGTWVKSDWENTRDATSEFICFTCAGKPVGTLEAEAKEVVAELQEQFDEATNKYKKDSEAFESTLAAAKGHGPTRVRLEEEWRKLGADLCAFRQNFCGNHSLKLLDPLTIDNYLSVFQPDPILVHIRGFLLALGRLQKMCVPRPLSDAEIDEMDDLINEAWYHLQHYVPDKNVTPKLHTLLEHVVPFMREHHTWAKTSEQPIESVHAVCNVLKQKYRTTRNMEDKFTYIFKCLLYKNHVHDTV